MGHATCIVTTTITIFFLIEKKNLRKICCYRCDSFIIISNWYHT